jgi:hypothetical protein
MSQRLPLHRSSIGGPEVPRSKPGERFERGRERTPRGRSCAAAAVAVLVLGLGAGTARAAAPSAASAAPPAVPSAELPPLPEPPPLKLGRPQPADVERLEGILSTLVGTDDVARRSAAAEVATVHAGLVAAIAVRLDRAADDADRGQMKELLLDIRKRARDEARREMRAAGARGEVKTPDYFAMVVEHPDPGSRDWRELVQVLAMSRMLVAIETVESVRVLIEVYTRFSFLRVDTQLQLEKLGDRAVAALIEARRHRAAEVSRWASRQLDALGRAIPGEAVQIRDPEVLADVLRAYGQVRDPDAARIVVSFANSERAQVREAARQSIALMGDVAMWQLRDAYENTVGRRPPRDWSWRRLARELFAEYDRQRLSRVYELYAEGQAAEQRGDLAAMRAAYDKVLTRNPEFEHRAAMASGYLAFARGAAVSDPAAAEAALVRASRIVNDPTTRDRIQSLRWTLQARRWLAAGIADHELVQRAVDLDPGNELARQVMTELTPLDAAAATPRSRWIAAWVIAAVAGLGALFVTFWPRRRAPRTEAVTAPPLPAVAPPAAQAASSNSEAAPEAPALAPPSMTATVERGEADPTSIPGPPPAGPNEDAPPATAPAVPPSRSEDSPTATDRTEQPSCADADPADAELASPAEPAPSAECGEPAAAPPTPTASPSAPSNGSIDLAPREAAPVAADADPDAESR